jgi:McbB family protein
MNSAQAHYFVADFSLLRGETRVICLGPSGVSVFDIGDGPLLLQLDGHRGSTLTATALVERHGATAEALQRLTAHGLLIERSTARRGFSSVTLQSDDRQQARDLAESLAPSGLDLQVLDLDAALPPPRQSTVLVTFQQAYRPGYLSERRALPSAYFQLNTYSLGPVWYMDPLFSADLGSPCHDCFLGRRAHLNATAKGPDSGDWLRFEYLLDEFKPLTQSRPTSPVERGLANFHLYRTIRSLTDAHAPRLRSEDLQSTLSVSLLDGSAAWHPLSHWDMCDCIQPGTGGGPPATRKQ